MQLHSTQKVVRKSYTCEYVEPLIKLLTTMDQSQLNNFVIAPGFFNKYSLTPHFSDYLIFLDNKTRNPIYNSGKTNGSNQKYQKGMSH